MNLKFIKLKAFITGIFVGTKNFAVPAVNAFVASRPEFLPHWLLISGLYGAFFDVRQEKINEFVSFIQEYPEVFTKEIIVTPEFKDGFLVTFESYIKQRNDYKREYIKKIFLHFTISSNKNEFELERMYDLLNKLNPYQIGILNKISKNVIVIKNYERDDDLSDYDDIKYLQALGLLYVESSQTIEASGTADERVRVDREGDYVGGHETEIEAEFEEREKFSLSIFGEDFVKFILQ